MLIVLHFDMPYIKWAKIFIKSIEKIEPEAKIYISAINFNNKSLRYFNKLKNVIKVKRININIINSENHKGKRGKWMTQIISIRSAIFLEVIKKYPNEDLYITTDVDMLMVNNLKNLRQNMKNSDVGIYIKKDKVMAGFVCIKNIESGIKFVKLWDKVCDGRYIETIDQIGLHKSYIELKDKIKIYNIGIQYLDPFCDENSFLWSAHKSSTGPKDLKFDIFNTFIRSIKKNKNVIIEDLVSKLSSIRKLKNIEFMKNKEK